MSPSNEQGAAESSSPEPLRNDMEALSTLADSSRALMLRAARRYLRRHPVLKGLYDEEDAVDEALIVLWAEFGSGKRVGIGEFGGLWRRFDRTLAHWISLASRRLAAGKRGGSGIRRGSGSAGTTTRSHTCAASPDCLDRCESKAPRPEIAVMQAEVVDGLLALLDSKQRDVVRLRAEGLSVPQIGLSLGLSGRTVNRVLKQVRGTWRTSGLLDEPRTDLELPGGRRAENREREAGSPIRPCLSGYRGGNGSAPASKHASSDAD